MSWICHNPRIVFLHVPRTAGTSMVEALSAVRELHPFPPDKGYYIGDHGTAIPDDCRDYPILACVRDPYRRELSHYLWHRSHDNPGCPVQVAAQMMSYEDYLEFRARVRGIYYDDFHRRLFGTQAAFLKGVEPTHLMRYEHVQEDFARVTRELFGDVVPFGRSAASEVPRYDPAKYYTPKAVEFLRRVAAKDFRRFGYDKEWKP